MNIEMAYLIGMILGNGEIQKNNQETIITIDIPHKNLYTDDFKDVRIYVQASVVDIRNIIEPLIGSDLKFTQEKKSTKISFVKKNEEYIIRQILKYVSFGSRHKFMVMNRELFKITLDEKKSLLRGIADVTGYIRKSNEAYGQEGANRVYIEVPVNWQLTIDVSNMLKDAGVPVQNIDFGHPNFRDSNLKKYNEGNKLYWKKEHQIKIYANEFVPIGFNVKHKQESLEKYSNELINHLNTAKTHKFYWQKSVRHGKIKPIHPGENDSSLPIEIRGKHFNSWTELAKVLGYEE